MSQAPNFDFRDLAVAIDFYTLPDEHETWEQQDCIIRMLDPDTVTITYPDESIVTLRNTHGTWQDAEQLRPVSRGLPGN